MRILIVGAGVVGTSLAEQLSTEGHQVSIIDRDRRLINELLEKFDILALHGDACSDRLLNRAGLKHADMLIAVTNVDEVNLVLGIIAARNNIPRRIIRVRNREYGKHSGLLPLGELGIHDVINPEPVVVDSLVRMIDIPGCNDVFTLANGQAQVLGFTLAEDSPMRGHTLAELRQLGDLNSFLILYINRGDQLIVPSGEATLEAGDVIHLLVSTDTLPFILPMVHRSPPKINQVIIVGASRIGMALAKTLQEKVKRTILIEPDEELAREAAAKLDKATVLQGDATDLEVLNEASIEICDLFCAVTGDDQENMLSSLLAKRHSEARTAVLVSQPEYVPVLDRLGVERVINPRLVTVSEILRHIRRGRIHSVNRVADSHAEILELEAQPGSRVVGGPLNKIKFPKGALIGGILSDDIMEIPNGETEIQPGQRVVVFTLAEEVKAIEKLFGAY